MKNVLILNGSPHGRRGNCFQLISYIESHLNGNLHFETLHLAQKLSNRLVYKKIEQAAGVIVVTGTYWDSWGSPLQKFLEEFTDLEGTPAVLGKPCAVFVLMHSVGGKSVLSRLQGVLSTFGFLIPPMTGMVHSLVADIASSGPITQHQDDFWGTEDIPIILNNFSQGLRLKAKWLAWPVDRKNYKSLWVKPSARTTGKS